METADVSTGSNNCDHSRTRPLNDDPVGIEIYAPIVPIGISEVGGSAFSRIDLVG